MRFSATGRHVCLFIIYMQKGLWNIVSSDILFSQQELSSSLLLGVFFSFLWRFALRH